jgi:formylglycine-generating enzyme required for sulfatase activity
MLSPAQLGKLLSRWQVAHEGGVELSARDLCRDHPEELAELSRFIEVLRAMSDTSAPATPLAQLPAAANLDAFATLPTPAAANARSTIEPNPRPTIEPNPADPTLVYPGLPPVIPASPTENLAPGYVVIEKLGEGGMGVIFKARQVALNRVVAVKVIRAGAHASSEERQRFIGEAEAIAAVKHPGIVEVYEFGTHAGEPYFAIEFCARGSLSARLAGKALSAREAARLVEQIALAVHAAHQAGILHRDLKPGNVLLAEDGSPKVTDFGLAKKVEGDSKITRTGAIVGTPSYMSPEQARGVEVCTASDVYALGAILYECVTGRPPFLAASPMETLRQVLDHDPIPPRRLQPQLDQDIEVICLKCLEKEPKKRYASAEALAEDLRRFLAGESIVARPAGPIERSIRWTRRHPREAILSAAIVVVALMGATGIVWQWRAAVSALEGEHQAQKALALRQVEELLNAQPLFVRGLLKTLPYDDPQVVARLRQVWNEEGASSRGVHAGLALLHVQPEEVRDRLAALLPEMRSPLEVLLVCDELEPFGNELAPGLWKQLDNTSNRDRHIRLLVALAEFDPESPRWPRAADTGLYALVYADSLHLGRWVEALRPVRKAWLAPLTEVYLGHYFPERREAATVVLADFLRDDPVELTRLILQGDGPQQRTLFPALAPGRDRIVELLRAELDCKGTRLLPPPEKYSTSESRKIYCASVRTNAAITLARLGEPESLWSLFGHRPDPQVRSYAIERLGPCGIPAKELLDHLAKETDATARAGLILALGEYGPGELSKRQKERAIELLKGWYRKDPCVGVHSAIEWLFRPEREGPVVRPLAWKQGLELAQLDASLAARSPREATRPGDPPAWWVNSNAKVFAVVAGPVEFLMGTPGPVTETEAQHQRRILRSFALATHPTTHGDFMEFTRAQPKLTHSPAAEAGDPEQPALSVSWYDAVQYCRWLSERDGVPEDQMCYPSLEEIEKCKVGKLPLTLPNDFLSRTGYRLPTEAEWEYACRAGTLTPSSHGEDRNQLGRYAWYAENSHGQTWPVGQKRPNEFGMFDLIGNSWEWCQNAYEPYPRGTSERPVEDVLAETRVAPNVPRALRGSDYENGASRLHCAARGSSGPDARGASYGFRIARTLQK